MTESSFQRVKNAFVSAIWATFASMSLGLAFKIWLAQWVDKSDLALYHTVVDIISMSLILLSGFRASMVVSFSQTKNDADITNIFRYSLITMVLFTWGLVLPYIKHQLNIDVEYIQLVGVILGMGFKVYFTNQIGMYRLYDIANKAIWIEPLVQVLLFLVCFYLFGQTAVASLFFSLMLSNFAVATYMFIQRRKLIATTPLAPVQLDEKMKSFVKKSMMSSLEVGASILMIYAAVLLTIGYFTIDELGDFQVVVRPVLAYFTMLFVFPVYRYILPEIAQCLRHEQHQEIALIRRWFFKLSLAISASLLLVLVLFSDEIVGFIFPQTYAKAAPVLLHFSLFFGFMMLNAFQVAYIKAHGLFLQSLMIRLLGVATLLSMFYLLRLFTDNVVAVILALGFGYLAMFIASSIIERKLLKQHSFDEANAAH
ncbi:lipopolysaccharide biosynthesis protein [Shewanella sp. 10N.261.52.F9]|uniref:lipopolysaccharide biosynthesis protein n=1 Tax=Shewanella sp. 10N.261.52.F9 TaxID=3229684 RepID=UPI00355406A5